MPSSVVEADRGHAGGGGAGSPGIVRPLWVPSSTTPGKDEGAPEVKCAVGAGVAEYCGAGCEGGAVEYCVIGGGAENCKVCCAVADGAEYCGVAAVLAGAEYWGAGGVTGIEYCRVGGVCCGAGIGCAAGAEYCKVGGAAGIVGAVGRPGTISAAHAPVEDVVVGSMSVASGCAGLAAVVPDGEKEYRPLMGTSNFTAGKVIVSIGVVVPEDETPLTSCREEVPSTVALGRSCCGSGLALASAGAAIVLPARARGGLAYAADGL
jgi:hypothetical protein